MKPYRQHSSSLRAVVVRLGAAVLCVGCFGGIAATVSTMSAHLDQSGVVGIANASINNRIELGEVCLSGAGREVDGVLASSLAEENQALNNLGVPEMRDVKLGDGASLLSERLSVNDAALMRGAEFGVGSIFDSNQSAHPVVDMDSIWQTELAYQPYETPKFAEIQPIAINDYAVFDGNKSSANAEFAFMPSTLLRSDGSHTYVPPAPRDSLRFFAETKAAQNRKQPNDVTQAGGSISTNAPSQRINSPVYIERNARKSVGVRRGATPGTGVVAISID